MLNSFRILFLSISSYEYCQALKAKSKRCQPTNKQKISRRQKKYSLLGSKCCDWKEIKCTMWSAAHDLWCPSQSPNSNSPIRIFPMKISSKHAYYDHWPTSTQFLHFRYNLLVTAAQWTDNSIFPQLCSALMLYMAHNNVMSYYCALGYARYAQY